MNLPLRLSRFFLLLTLLTPLPACSSGEDNSPPPTAPQNNPAQQAVTEKTESLPRPYIEMGDLPQIKKHGKLRILTLRHPEGTGYLPRKGHPRTHELQLVEQFAQSQGLNAERVYVDSLDDLIPMLLAGKGDLVAENLAITRSRKKKVAFSAPVYYIKEQIIRRKDDTVSKPHDLANRTVVVQASSSFKESLAWLQKQRFQPKFTIETVNGEITTESLLDGVARGNYDLGVADSNLVDAMLDYRDDLAVAFDLSRVRSIAWAIRPNATKLQAALNDFLARHHIGEKESISSTGDLAAIKKRGVLRVLTRNNASTYFLWRGELLGFEYELMKRFADSQKLRLEMVVPPTRADLIPWLLDGRGDVIAASMTINDELEKEGIAFTRPYHEISELLVSRASDKPLTDIEDLSGRTVVVRSSSNYWLTLEKLLAAGNTFRLEAAPEYLETEDIIDKVAKGDYDLTVADSHILDIEMTWRNDVTSSFPLGEPHHHGWVVRNNNKELLNALNRFIKKEYRGLFYNLTLEKYFQNRKHILKHVNQRVDKGNNGQLSPYDDTAKKYAKQYGFDWRLIVAQMYQESRFKPNVKSWMGALGLMQVLPRTAKSLKIKGDLRNKDIGIYAGVKYLDWLMRRFETSLDVGERTWFALAAYNAGIGHVRDARRLARQKGWRSDQWFDNVEKAMLLLSKRKYAKKAKHGYAHGHETVAYVRDIRERYQVYLELTKGNDKMAANR